MYIHISKEHLAILFGADAELTVKKSYLNRVSLFAMNVTIVGPKGEMANVSILGTNTSGNPSGIITYRCKKKLVLTHQFVNPANWKVIPPDVN